MLGGRYIEFHSVIPLTEPYRLMLSEIRDRLWHTREVLQSCMIHTSCAPLCGFLLHSAVSELAAMLQTCKLSMHSCFDDAERTHLSALAGTQ